MDIIKEAPGPETIPMDRLAHATAIAVGPSTLADDHGASADDQGTPDVRRVTELVRATYTPTTHTTRCGRTEPTYGVGAR